MPNRNRRSFLKQVSTGIVSASVLQSYNAVGAIGANEKIVIGLIGCGGMGRSLLRSFAQQKDVEVAYVCDVDSKHTEQGKKIVQEAANKTPQVVRDMRKVFDDKSVHAVVMGTPDHWHGPATILACQAGKHVYVEKPGSHNIREGRLMIEAARRYHRIVQVGTQSRSQEHVIRAMELLHDGAIGNILVAKAWNSQRRGNIGRVQPSDPPARLDYDQWVGPAPFIPYKSNRLHSNWRWSYHFGTGDIGNDGVHDIDLARWGLGVETHPSTIAALGGKFFFNDDRDFPDTQYVVYEYPGDGKIGHKKQLIYEQRDWSPYVQEGYENGDAFYGTEGMMILGKQSGWQLFGPRNKLRDSMKCNWNNALHHRDFLESIKTGKPPRAEVGIHHLSATLSHLGNIATRVGRVIHFDPPTEKIIGDTEANEMTRRTYRQGHWAVPKNVI
jgi:predicted dehydrogenase